MSSLAFFMVLLYSRLIPTVSQPFGPDKWPSDGCNATHPGPPIPIDAVVQMTVTVDDPLLFNPNRQYYMYLPPNYTVGTPMPIVIHYHGFYESAEADMNSDRLMHLSRVQNSSDQFIVVHPVGKNDCGSRNCEKPYVEASWNAGGASQSPGPMGHTCNQSRDYWGTYPCYASCQTKLYNGCEDNCHSATCANDTLFFTTLLQELEKKICLDVRRVYITGMSVGGMMALELAMKFGDRIAAAVPVAGSAMIGFWKANKIPIPLMDIHGVLDTTIPPNVTSSWKYPTFNPAPYNATLSNDGFYYTPNHNITRDIAQANGCAMDGTWIPWTTMYDGVANWTCGMPFGNCPQESPLVRCTWYGQHEYPFIGHRYNRNINHTVHKNAFSQLVWEFLSKFRLSKQPLAW